MNFMQTVIQYPSLKVKSIRRRNIGDHQCGFQRNRSTAGQIFAFMRHCRKKWEYNETVHQLFIEFKEAYNSVRREVLYNILIEFEVPTKILWLIK
jgi:hypothetical protein